MRKVNTVFFAILAVSLVWIGLAGCSTRSDVRVPAEDLLLDDISVFPAGWTIESPPYSARDLPSVLQDQRAIDFADVGFAPPRAEFNDPTASQIIWNFGNGMDATLAFYTRFRPSGHELSDEALDGWSPQSPVADRYRYSCAFFRSTPRAYIARDTVKCEIVAQYGEFISTFTAPIGDEYNMTIEDLERILKAIDERMVRDR